jgi:uncharacterized protein (TIGR02145 family)
MIGRGFYLLVMGALLTAHGGMAQNLCVNPESVAYDYVHHRYLVSDCSGAIIQIDSLGNQSYFASSLPLCISICIKDTLVYVSSANTLMAFHLETGQRVSLPLTGLPSPVGPDFDGLAADTSGNLYMVDQGGRIIKIRLSDYHCSIFVSSGLTLGTQDIAFDAANNRLLVAAYYPSAPIQAVSLADSTVSNVVATTAGWLDGITIDRFGNVYISHSVGGRIYRYRSGFTTPPEVISTGHVEPAGLEYNNEDDVLAIPNFSAGRIDFVPVDFPTEINQWDVRDDAGGDGDGLFEEGESIDIVLTVVNYKPISIRDVTLRLLLPDASIIPINTQAFLGDVAALDTVDNSASPLTFAIPTEHIPSYDSFYVELSYDRNGLIADTSAAWIALGTPRLLIVDDDAGDTLEDYYTQTLGHLHIPSAVLDASQPFSASDLSGYDLVIWFTGDNRTEPISTDDMAAMQGLMDTGGKLFLTGQRIAAQLAGSGQSGFLNDYLRSTYLSTSADIPLLCGLEGSHVLWPGDTILFKGGGAAANNQTAPDHIAAANGGIAEMKYFGQSDMGAVSYDGAYQVLFFSYGFESVATGNSRWCGRDTLMTHILDFFHYRQPTSMHLIVSPGNQMRLASHTPTLSWSYDVFGYSQQSFHLQVGTDLDWTTAEMWDYGPIAGSDTSIVYAGAELLDGDTYPIRIRVSDGAEWSSWYYGIIRLNVAPTIPTELTPDGGMEVSGIPPYTLSHNNAIDADGDDLLYSYAVYDDSLLTVLVAEAAEVPENPAGTTTWQITTPLTPGNDYFWCVRAGDGSEFSDWSSPAAFVVGQPYICGDAGGDMVVNVADAVFLINYAFKGGQAPDPIQAGDANCDGVTDVGDAVFLISYIFKGGAAPCCPSAPGTVTDFDGNVYQTVTIGTQVWMAENLKVTHYRNGDAIPNVTDGTTWQGLTTGAYCEYSNDVNSVATYGRLYNWHAVADIRNIAPPGWHVASDAEWKQLEMYLGMNQTEADQTGWRGTDEGGKLKENGTVHWTSPNTGATNESGFAGLPGGYRHLGDYYDLCVHANFWSSTENGGGFAWCRNLGNAYSGVHRFDGSKEDGFSVRCVKD